MLIFEREEKRIERPHFQKIEIQVCPTTLREKYLISSIMKPMLMQWEGQGGYELVKKWLKSIVLSLLPVMI
jgi:hypothetical protein